MRDTDHMTKRLAESDARVKRMAELIASLDALIDACGDPPPESEADYTAAWMRNHAALTNCLRHGDPIGQEEVA